MSSSDNTVCVSLHQLTSSTPEPGWTVYRVRTQRSLYHLGLFEGSAAQRPFAILRGTSGTTGEALDVEDCAPLVGGASLFSVPPSGWPGKALEIGSSKTSAVVSVEAESDALVIREMTTQTGVRLAAPRSPPPPSPQQSRASSDWAPYPEKYVEYVETAAALLRSVYRKERLFEDLAAHDHLKGRMQVALAECWVLVKGLGPRAS